MKIISWNVNGIRAIEKKGFRDWLIKSRADIVAIQETKAQLDQIPNTLRGVSSYHDFWHSGERKGYSSVGLYTKLKPKKIVTSFGNTYLDSEGRTQCADFGSFMLFNLYVPNGGQGPHRIEYKMNYYAALSKLMKKMLRKQKNVIICGDINTAHTEIDLARPKENENNTGFLPKERAWITSFLDDGFVDIFRRFNTKTDQYTWWDYKTRSRDRNVGWRIDYFFLSPAAAKKATGASILSEVYGSDHCPIRLDIKL